MIKTEHLCYIYQEGMPQENAALDDINIEIKTGEFTAIIGHTGSGKSTLIQHLNALLRPTSGKIIIDGIDITAQGADLKAVRRKVGLVFQYPEHQLFEETVYKDIAFGPKNMGLSEEETDRRVRKAACDVGIAEELLEVSPFDLSGGQKRRAAIAGVLATEPSVLILDEPTAGLDPRGRDNIIKLLKNIKKLDESRTIIFVSHSMEDVARLADSVIVMNKGKAVMKGSVSEVFSKGELLSDMGLDVPQVTKLFIMLRKMGLDLPSDIFTVDAAEAVICERLFGGAPC